MCFVLREWWTSRCDIGVADIRNTRPGAPSSPTSLALLLPHLMLPPSSSSPATFLPLSAFLACVIYEEFALSLWVCLYNNVAGTSAGVSLLCTCVFSSDCAPSWTTRASSLWLQQLLGRQTLWHYVLVFSNFRPNTTAKSSRLTLDTSSQVQ